MLLKQNQTKVGISGEQCSAKSDCNSGAGLECTQGVCSSPMTFQWNTHTLKCDLCAPNYLRRGNYCGLFAYFLFLMKIC